MSEQEKQVANLPYQMKRERTVINIKVSEDEQKEILNKITNTAKDYQKAMEEQRRKQLEKVRSHHVYQIRLLKRCEVRYHVLHCDIHACLFAILIAYKDTKINPYFHSTYFIQLFIYT